LILILTKEVVQIPNFQGQAAVQETAHAAAGNVAEQGDRVRSFAPMKPDHAINMDNWKNLIGASTKFCFKSVGLFLYYMAGSKGVDGKLAATKIQESSPFIKQIQIVRPGQVGIWWDRAQVMLNKYRPDSNFSLTLFINRRLSRWIIVKIASECLWTRMEGSTKFL
jgi:hypothetical protein